MKKLTIIPSFALTVSINSAAQPDMANIPSAATIKPTTQAASTEVNPQATTRGSAGKLLLNFKDEQFKKALEAAGADKANVEKIMQGMQDVVADKKQKIQDIKTKFTAGILAVLKDGGLREEKAREVMNAYQERVKDLRTAIKSALMQFAKQLPQSSMVPHASVPKIPPTHEQVTPDNKTQEQAQPVAK